ncbi:unnamed protein product [Gongylonema pulchrum]|uniref:Uncharacterized protein n=1 Tax=Gongylonema pulchrum TaxID=637853 RepID=A0A183EXJ1_9BILA|nr:unnamed protein product [Gongylonema pulchrum]
MIYMRGSLESCWTMEQCSSSAAQRRGYTPVKREFLDRKAAAGSPGSGKPP